MVGLDKSQISLTWEAYIGEDCTSFRREVGSRKDLQSEAERLYLSTGWNKKELTTQDDKEEGRQPIRVKRKKERGERTSGKRNYHILQA